MCNIFYSTYHTVYIHVHVHAYKDYLYYVWLFMSVNVSVFVNVSEFGHWVCGESWHATKDL